MHGEKCLLEAPAFEFRIELAAARVTHFEILDPEWRRLAVGHHAIRTLVEDAQVEIFEQRQHVGHGHGLAAAIQAQVQRTAAIVAWPQLHA